MALLGQSIMSGLRRASMGMAMVADSKSMHEVGNLLSDEFRSSLGVLFSRQKIWPDFHAANAVKTPSGCFQEPTAWHSQTMMSYSDLSSDFI